jgi:reversibly glycosylated polypeptide/UDP-arabinopyranose mutase
MVKNIAIVVPTIRPEIIGNFLKEWKSLFDKHNVEFILVVDGEDQHIIHDGERKDLKSDLVSKFCAGSRQLGFLYITNNLPAVEYIFTTDDDCAPIGDPIQDHIDALNRKVPISWFSTASDFMRGFPYQVREEAQVYLSHGVWEGNYDWDAPSQLLKKDVKVDFYKGAIPKGIFFPMCGMNLGFRREALPYIYFAPVGQFKGAER